MNKIEQPGGSWWQTVPGILTAVTGVLTALAGLLVVLHQVGLLSNMEQPASVSSSSGNDATIGHGARVPAMTPAKTNEHVNDTANDRVPQYTVAFPSGSELILRSNRGEGTYSILTAQVESRNSGKLSLTFSIRLTNKGPADTEFGSGLFRLLVDGVPRAPTSYLNDLVEARSAKEGDVMFEIPDTSRTLMLSVDTGKESGNIPLTLKKSG